MSSNKLPEYFKVQELRLKSSGILYIMYPDVSRFGFKSSNHKMFKSEIKVELGA